MFLLPDQKQQDLMIMLVPFQQLHLVLHGMPKFCYGIQIFYVAVPANSPIVFVYYRQRHRELPYQNKNQIVQEHHRR